MGRWEPGTRERLQQAALELFATRGFEQTTAAEIAGAVGLTERTFYRHFADKREVLFSGQHLLAEAFATGARAAPAGAAPLEVVAGALRAGAVFFPDERRRYSRSRQAVIEANPALQERERHKGAELAAVLRDEFLARGTGEPTATLAAESGATVFGIAFRQWITDGEQRSLADIGATVLDQLGSLTGTPAAAPGR
jgi:AcrR family transcriptional regulator